MYMHATECLNGAETRILDINVYARNGMSQWCRDHTDNVDNMGIMFYIILTIMNMTILFVCYKMFCCNIFQQPINGIVWFVQKHLGILYYQVFISEVKWFGIEYT